MRKLSFLLLFAFTSVVVFAQGGKVNSAITNLSTGDLAKAKESIDLAVEHEKTKGKAKTWKVKAQVYQAIAIDTNSTLCPNAINKSIESYKKAQELDVKNRLLFEINKSLVSYTNALYTQVQADWDNKSYKEAFAKCEAIVEIGLLQAPPVIDTLATYYAALAANNAAMYDEAIVFYQKSADLGNNTTISYDAMSKIELLRGDSVKFISYLETGIVADPENSNMLFVALINYYLGINQSDSALGAVNKAIEKDPTNPTFYFVQGSLYDKLEDLDNSQVSYEKAIELKPDYFDAYYNLGAVFYNKGVAKEKLASTIPQNKQAEYDAAIKESLVEFANAVPYFEKAHEIDNTEKSAVQTLKGIFYKLQSSSDDYKAKYDKYNELLKTL